MCRATVVLAETGETLKHNNGPAKGKKNNRHSRRGGKSRQRTSTRKTDIESIELKLVTGGSYLYEFTTKAGVTTPTTSFELKDAGKRLRAIANEYHVTRKQFVAMLAHVRDLQNDAQIDAAVETKFASIASEGELIDIEGEKMFLVPAAQLRDGGQITFGESKFVLANVDNAIDNATAPPMSDKAMPSKGKGKGNGKAEPEAPRAEP